jgi:hypothetical protein
VIDKILSTLFGATRQQQAVMDVSEEGNIKEKRDLEKQPMINVDDI